MSNRALRREAARLQEEKKAREEQKRKNRRILIFLLVCLVLLGGTLGFAIGTLFSKDSNYVKVETSEGSFFVMELYPEQAPITVKNFKKLVKSGFYDGLTFHRIIQEFMVQGGDPQGNGSGGSSETIKGEFSANGWTQNTLSHVKGTVSMARSQDYDSASSQFFICTGDASFLDGQYAAFGRVVYGMEAVMELDAYGAPPGNNVGKPSKIVKMTKVTLLSQDEYKELVQQK